MRKQFKLHNEVIVSLLKYKELIYGSEARIYNGYLVAEAYRRIQEKVENIDWVKVSSKNLNSILNDNDIDIPQGYTVTALNIDARIIEKLEELRKIIASQSGGNIYMSFAIKILLRAAILLEIGEIEQFEK